MADVKTVRLRNITSGVVAETSEENAARLADFEPATKPTAKRVAAQKSE